MKLHLAGQDFNVGRFSVTLIADDAPTICGERDSLVYAIEGERRFYCQGWHVVPDYYGGYECEVMFLPGTKTRKRVGPKKG